MTVAVKVQPKSHRPGLHGVLPGAEGSRLRIAVTEAADRGAANRATCSVLARALGVPPSAVQVVAGAASREKLLRVAGDPAALAVRLAAL
ncbi:MAG TPA: DUF167 domain-containing protein [Acetobacteraceae bacterium]